MDSRSQRPQGPSSTGSPPDGVAPPNADTQHREARRRRLSLLLSVTLVAVMVGWLIKTQAPFKILAAWHYSTAQAKLAEDDLDGALAACERAVAAAPDDASFYALRAQIHQEQTEWAAALEDLNKVQELNPHFPQGLLQRSFVHMQLKDYDAAVADARKARDWWGKDDPRALNHVAYTLAVANRELAAALADAERAVKLLKAGRDRAHASNSSSGTAATADGKTSPAAAEAPAAADQPADDSDESLSSYLDTRAFVLLRLGEQEKGQAPGQAKGHFESALADFDEAIRLLNRFKKAALEKLKTQGPAQQAYAERHLNASLGLMHHHRYQTHEALGQTEQAGVDKEFAARLGYDPAKHGL